MYAERMLTSFVMLFLCAWPFGLFAPKAPSCSAANVSCVPIVAASVHVATGSVAPVEAVYLHGKAIPFEQVSEKSLGPYAVSATLPGHPHPETLVVKLAPESKMASHKIGASNTSLSIPRH